MSAAPVTADAVVGDRAQRLRDVRGWFAATVPGPTVWQRLETVYTFVLITAIFGVGIFDAVHTALAQVLSFDGATTWGPPVVLVTLLVAARWGAYQGPVVFSVADVAHLLGAPLDRRALAARRLATSLGYGAVTGALLGGVLDVGLAGDGRTLDAGRAAGLCVALAAVGVIGVAGAWAVQASARLERLLTPLTWGALVAATGAGLIADRTPGARRIMIWSGPWGWAAAPVQAKAWPLAVALLAATAAVAATLALRRCGGCSAERHLRRAEARAGAAASLAAFDARSMRRALSTVSAGGAPRATGRLRWPGRKGLVSLLAWRGVTALRRTPARAAEGVVLGGGGAALLLVAADRVTAALGGGLLLYLAATRLLEPLREEIDKPGRTRILLTARWGHVLFAHAILPGALLAVATLLTLAGCAVGGVVDTPAGGVAAVALLAVPSATLAAALSSRRGGRLPQSVLTMATGTDAGGTGGFLIVGYLLLWPLVGAVGAGLPAALVAHGGSRALEPAILLSAVVTAILATILRHAKAP